MEENIFQFSGGIKANVNASVKGVMCVKKIIFGILQHIVLKMDNV